jgi:hypothetical protein
MPDAGKPLKFVQNIAAMIKTHGLYSIQQVTSAGRKVDGDISNPA